VRICDNATVGREHRPPPSVSPQVGVERAHVDTASIRTTSFYGDDIVKLALAPCPENHGPNACCNSDGVDNRRSNLSQVIISYS
jgi:hypothetical protein